MTEPLLKMVGHLIKSCTHNVFLALTFLFFAKLVLSERRQKNRQLWDISSDMIYRMNREAFAHGQESGCWWGWRGNPKDNYDEKSKSLSHQSQPGFSYFLNDMWTCDKSSEGSNIFILRVY